MIQLRNLDASLKQWIISQTGIGPVGELFYLAGSAGNPIKVLRGERVDGGVPLVDEGHIDVTGPYKSSPNAPHTATMSWWLCPTPKHGMVTRTQAAPH